MLGFLDGANIAIKFALKYPKKVKASILNGGNLNAEELNKIKASTLVIAGTKDMIKEIHTREIASSIPNSELVFIPGNHFIAEKKSEDFNQVVDKFLLKTNA